MPDVCTTKDEVSREGANLAKGNRSTWQENLRTTPSSIIGGQSFSGVAW